MLSANERPLSTKFVISGGFGAGKTTMVGTISEIKPLRTEGSMTDEAIGVDDGSVVPDKTTTTVAMDFGRLTIDDSLMLYLFGTPGQDRFGFMWKDICEGALGAVVLVDTRRLDDCFPAVDYFEERGIPFVMALNMFGGSLEHELDAVRTALAIDDEVPLIPCDARANDSVRNVLVELCQHVLGRIGHSEGAQPEPVGVE